MTERFSKNGRLVKLLDSDGEELEFQMSQDGKFAQLKINHEIFVLDATELCYLATWLKHQRMW